MSISRIENLAQSLKNKSDRFWLKDGERMALRLFKEASVKVPAYRDFLRSHRINPVKIKTISDFYNVPSITKDNYLLKYPLEKLCWNGDIAKSDMISASSGSSGKPFYWPRTREQEDETSLSHELFLRDSFEIDKRSTLFIVSFAMGMWVAGTLTHRAVQNISEKYPMTVITPGINKSDVISIIKKMGDKYKQTIIAGYPPFVKDIIDEGEAEGINWKKYNIKFLFAAEAFSEEWRSYLYKKIGSRNNLKDSLNIYGTADALILGHETPLSILIRRIANKKADLYKKIFQYDERTPSLVQYNPTLRYFESVDGDLIFSAFSGIPLVRYSIGDKGNVVNYSDMASILKNFNINIDQEARSNKISNWKWPFLYVYGRSDFTANLYGINIYPENIRDALGHKKIANFVSGKLAMVTKSNKNMDQCLEINIELKDGLKRISAGLDQTIKEVIVETLKNKNKEYNELYKSLGFKAEPIIKLCQYGQKDLFASGAKQKWYIKNV